MPATSLVTLYLEAAGRSAVPPVYHTWTCRALIAACVANRVGIRKWADEPTGPGIYVLLVGDSGSGKGRAVKFGLKLGLAVPGLDVFSGETTAPAFVVHLEQLDKAGEPSTWLVQEELSSDLGSGEEADRFLRFMTKIHNDQTGAIRKATVTRGQHRINKPVSVTWLAASTERWLRSAVKPEMFEGGFVGRLCPVLGPVVPLPWLAWPEQPFDFAQRRDELVRRFTELTTVNGSFTLDDQALEIHELWSQAYHDEPPADWHVQPWWVRADELLLKLAMIEALTTWTPGDPLVIGATTYTQARRLLGAVERDVRTLIRAMGATPKTQAIFDLERVLRAAGTFGTPRHMAHQQMRRFGHDGEEADKAFAFLEAEQVAHIIREGRRGGMWWALQRKAGVATKGEER